MSASRASFDKLPFGMLPFGNVSEYLKFVKKHPMKIPFTFGKIVQGNDFTDREIETQRVISNFIHL